MAKSLGARKSLIDPKPVVSKPKTVIRRAAGSVVGGPRSGKSPPKTTVTSSGKTGAVVVTRDASTGRFKVGGVDERKLIKKFDNVQTQPSAAEPRHWTKAQIKQFVLKMKVA